MSVTHARRPQKHAPTGPRRASLVPILLTAALALTGCDKITKKDAGPAPPSGDQTSADAHLASAAETPTPEPTVDPEVATPKVMPPSANARTEDERNTIDVFRAAAPATVFVTQSQLVLDRWSMRTAEVPAGAGTGFIWDTEGHIVTNCHVALPNCQGRPRKLEVTLFDQKTYPAIIRGIDQFKDIAVLKIEAPPESLTPIRQPPKGYALEVGQKTIAIGNPFGLDHTLTTGVISALGREVKGIGGTTIRDMVQTDAAINPGNSGGPLLDSQGQLIGMNTMIFSSSGSSAGIGFAVPVTTVQRIVPQVIKTGHPERVGIGISRFDDGVARRLGLKGVIVRTVESPTAREAGLRPAEEVRGTLVVDVIVGLDDKKIETFDDLFGAIEGRKVGEKVRVMVRRLPEDKVVTLEVPLIKLNSD